MKKYILPAVMLAIFETVAVSLWLTKNNLFYLLNFSYIGISIALGVFLYTREYKYARRVTQLLVGCYMLVYLGLICRENMQIEGFWYYLFTGVFEAATIHYAVAKILGPLLFGRGWCGYACWTAMVLDFTLYHICAVTCFCVGFISGTYRQYGTNYVLVIYHWKSALLRRWHYACILLSGQPRFLQIHLSCHGVFETHELLFLATDNVRQK